MMADKPDIKVIPHEAIAYIKSKGLATSYNWSEIYGKEHASKFTVAKIMELDVLDGIHQSVIEAVEEGQSFHSFKKGILARLGEDGWGSFEQTDEVTGEKLTRLSDRRLRKVYATNKTQSLHAGSWHRFEANKKTHPYLRYRLGSSVEHRPEHKRFKDLVLPVDDPFWQTHMPMNGWGCKCWVQSLTAEKAEKQGISDSPEIEYHDWVNKSTGRKHKVPKGVDPGFEYNVGKHREHKSLEMVTDKLTQAVSQNPSQANATMTALLNDTAQKEMVDKVIREMVSDVADNKRAYGNTYAVGTIKDEVIEKLEQMGKSPHHKIVAVRDVDVLHALRDSKRGKNNHLPVEFWQELVQNLQEPNAILLDDNHATPTLLYLYNTVEGKVVINMDYIIAIKDSKGKKVQVPLNIVKTGTQMPDNILKGEIKKHTIIWQDGSLDVG